MTLPQLLAKRSASSPKVVAWRQFRLGVWNEYTLADVHAEASAIGNGLASLGFAKGDVVAILAQNGVTSIAAEIGVQGIGCVAAVLSSALAPSTVRDVLALVEAKAVIVGDQEQYDKVHDVPVASVRSTVVLNARGFREIEVDDRPDADKILTIEQLKNRGGTGVAWDSQSAGLSGTDPATILCLVNRESREVEIHRYSHAAVLESAQSLHASVGFTRADVVAVHNSLGESVEHALSVVAPLVSGITVNIGQSGLSTQSMRQVQPSLVALHCGWLEGVGSDIERRVGASRGLKGMAARKALATTAPLGTAPAKPPKIGPTRAVGIVAALVAFVFLAVSVSLNDFVRVAIVAVLALVAALVTVVRGWSGVSSIRRAVGMSRTRAIISERPLDESTSPSAARLLGSLGIPIVVTPVPGEIIGRVRSEVLV